jgi:hypothetical protein
MTLKLLRFYKSRTSIITNGPIGKYYKGGFENNMSKREAYLILGLSSRASEEDLKNAHKKLMLLNHPDSGIDIIIILYINLKFKYYIK